VGIAVWGPPPNNIFFSIRVQSYFALIPSVFCQAPQLRERERAVAGASPSTSPERATLWLSAAEVELWGGQGGRGWWWLVVRPVEVAGEWRCS
jgi:hypothetical protein